MKSQRNRGFTLVDLVVTLVVLAILLGVATTRFVQLTKAAETSECRANLLALRTAQTFFFVQTNRDGQGRYTQNLEELIPFIKNEILPQCPSGGAYTISQTGGIRCSVSSHNP